MVRGQLSHAFLKKGKDGGQSLPMRFVLQLMLLNCLARPDFVAYCLEDRKCLSVALCRKIYKVQEVNWTIKTKEEMEKAERLGNLVIFEQFDPRG